MILVVFVEQNYCASQILVVVLFTADLVFLDSEEVMCGCSLFLPIAHQSCLFQMDWSILKL